ncbi:MAG TPA: DEAD/DEAH box helicase [Pseudomonadales bacterium]|nr:DEAD/DEAH box helicase [Pseudomonadales bacterium]
MQQPDRLEETAEALPFHPAVARWFERTFGGPTPAQRAAWPAIQRGEHTLIAAPTGSGKTLAAFLAVIDRLLRQGLTGELVEATAVVYVSPLKALSNDIQRNLAWPLAGIASELEVLGLPAVPLRVGLRSGDSTPAERTALLKRPPHILVTTPESLYLLLTSSGGRALFGQTHTLIIDEIHALIDSKRGAHLALSIERLQHLARQPLTRIGLSATQNPIAAVADFLVGAGDGVAPPPCHIIDQGHRRALDLDLLLPAAPLETVMSNEVWGLLYDQLAALILEHRTTLIFVNTRRLAERVTRQLSERLGSEAVAAHHGSLSKAQRFEAEQRLKAGELRALVATASLELGIDIGAVDLVCQLGATRAIATLLQRVGRSGHSVGGLPKGRLLPLSRDDLVEMTALIDAVKRGELDQLRIPQAPLDVLAQQIVAEVAAEPWSERALYALLSRAQPYRALPYDTFAELVRMLGEGYSSRRGRRGAYLYRDLLQGMLRPRPGARLTALTCGGTIPDTADYDVILEPAGTLIGSVNEDFAVESMAGDIFQLGNSSWRIVKVESGRLRVEDAAGQPPTIPFWLGEAPARSDALSRAVSRLRREVDESLQQGSVETAARALQARLGLPAAACWQLVEYLAAARAALGAMPSDDCLVLERFFDESGGMQLVLHAPFGGRINRAWGLALRKRFCRQFNFELQAAASENSIILSLGVTHSFPLAEVAGYLQARTVRPLLVQALLDAPLFQARWRWNALTALAIPRRRGGQRTPAFLQRIQAEDLIALVFPDQLACFENLQGEREIPDHPLVAQTLDDCLTEAMDIDGLERLLQRLAAGEIRLVCAELTEASPFAQEILAARPYAFLDDAPLEERRTQAVISRRWLDPATAADLGRLDAAAIERVRGEAWPVAHDGDALCDALLLVGLLHEEELAQPRTAGWSTLLTAAQAQGRVLCIELAGERRWLAIERLPQLLALHPQLAEQPLPPLPDPLKEFDWTAEAALVELLRARLESSGPLDVDELASLFALPPPRIMAALLKLEQEGFILRGAFSDPQREQWCERRLLARINRYTLDRLRRAIEPVSIAQFHRFIDHWQGVGASGSGVERLNAVIGQLAGLEATASQWEGELLPARLAHYDPAWLDQLTLSGRVVWTRLGGSGKGGGPLRRTPIMLLPRGEFPLWRALADADQGTPCSAGAERVRALLASGGALFFDELCQRLSLLPSHLERYLAELVQRGEVSADSFAGMRGLIQPAAWKNHPRYRRRGSSALAEAGRWSLLPPPLQQEQAASWFGARHSEQVTRAIAGQLLRRYGIIHRQLLERESRLLPPWRDLLRIYRRLEASGEIRGGHFIAGVSGEQYALPEAIGALRAVRHEEG